MIIINNKVDNLIGIKINNNNRMIWNNKRDKIKNINDNKKNINKIMRMIYFDLVYIKIYMVLDKFDKL